MEVHISRKTSQHQPSSGFHGQTDSGKPLLKETNKEWIITWAKKHKGWTLDKWKSVFRTNESDFESFSAFVRCRDSEWMISACVVHNVEHGEGSVIFQRKRNKIMVELRYRKGT